mgnify:CR=1 FL=1|jgi:calcineurin-like phosphoesterase family protein
MNYFTADLHIGHTNIIKMCNRPFENTDEMKQALIKNNNEIVTDNDDVWDLGDVAFKCSAWEVAETLNQFNGKRHIILGNHDKSLRKAYKKGLLKDMIRRGKLEIIGGEEGINDNTISTYKMISIDEHKVFIGHYALRTWPSAFRGTIHLYGHSHSNLSDFHKSFDIGVDTESETHRRFFPWNWDEIKIKADNINSEFKED